jgi:nucleoid DNA-binding protein
MSKKVFTLDIIKKVALTTEKTQKDVKVITNAIFDAISNELKEGNYVCIKDFVSMKPKQTKERTYNNNILKEPVVVPSKMKVQIKCSKVLSAKINEK